MSAAVEPRPSLVAAAERPTGALDFVALFKPRITLNVVFTTVCGLLVAPGPRSWAKILWVITGTALMVGGANTLNMYIERYSDALMMRTMRRPIPAGRVSPTAALIFGIALATVALPILGLGANLLTAALGAIALFSYVLVYTPMKRRSPAALLVGAVPGAIPPLMGWTAATGHLEMPGLVLFAMLFVWQVPHFLAIALYSSEDFARGGIKVTPLVEGVPATKRQIVIFTAALIPVSLALVPLGIGGVPYLVTALVGGALFLGYAVRKSEAGFEKAWARQLFIVSLIYLTALLVVLAVEGRIHAGV